MIVERAPTGVTILGGDVTLARVRVQALGLDGVKVNVIEASPRLTATISDVSVKGAGQIGVKIDHDAGERYTVTIERVSVEESTGSGLCVVNGPVRIRLADIRVAGIAGIAGSDPYCATAAIRCAGDGLLLRTNSDLVELDLERFHVSGAASSGIDVGVNVEAELKHDVVEARAGMVYRAAGDWRDHTLDVHFDAATPVDDGR